MKYTWETLTVAQYQRLLKMPKEPTTIQVIEALTGQPKNMLRIKDIKSLQIGDLTPRTDITSLPLFTHKGTLYGMQKTTDLSFGLFADIMEYGKDVPKFLPELVTTLYRPVKSMSFWSTVKLRIIANIAPRVNTIKWLRFIYKWYLNLDYELEEYDPIVTDRRTKEAMGWPASVAHHTSTFFLVLSKILQVDFLKSSRESLKKMQEEINQLGAKELQNMIYQDGNGTQSFGDSQEKTQPKSNQS